MSLSLSRQRLIDHQDIRGGFTGRACALDERQRCAHPTHSPGAALRWRPQGPQGVHQGISTAASCICSALPYLWHSETQITGHRLHVRRSTAQTRPGLAPSTSSKGQPPERYLAQGRGRQDWSFTEASEQSTKKSLRKTIPMPAIPPAAEEPEAPLVTWLTACNGDYSGSDQSRDPPAGPGLRCCCGAWQTRAGVCM